jgi:hypothetical protein
LRSAEIREMHFEYSISIHVVFKSRPVCLNLRKERVRLLRHQNDFPKLGQIKIPHSTRRDVAGCVESCE